MSKNFLEEQCTFYSFNHSDIQYCGEFDCDHLDLNDFFKNDSRNYSSQLLGKTYCFTLDSDPTQIVAAFTISNDSIKTTFLPNNPRNKLTKLIPREKAMRSYPAVLIGRLGVSKKHGRLGIGSQVMDFIKAWFIDKNNKTGCRFIVVDAYNESRPKDFYTKNGFITLFRNEEEEKKYLDIKEKEDDQPKIKLKTRLMYFDLINLNSVNT